MNDVKLLLLHSNIENICMQTNEHRLVKNIIKKKGLQIIYLIYMYKEDLELNNL